ncbi:MAG: GNAT family protein [Proteobacteria bacterium]|nr:GNAT family protein [Pseudomonadota bacterium]
MKSLVPAVDRPPKLVTERLMLRELRDDDAADVARGAGDRRVAKYLTQVPNPYTVAVARRWIAQRVTWWDTGKGATLAIVRRNAPDDVLGTVSLRRTPRDARAELGYWLAAPAWGAGIVSEATRSVVAWGFRDLGLRRIYAEVFAGNRASCRVLEKLGMTLEGLKREHVRKGHTHHDVLLYGLLRTEWKDR